MKSIGKSVAVKHGANHLALIASLLFAGSFGAVSAAGIMDNGVYFGAQIASFNYDQDDAPDLSPTALVFRAGYMINENFGVEGRLGGGMSKDDDDFEWTVGNRTDNNANFEVEIENFLGVYGVARYDLSESASIYGLAGFTSMSIKRSLDSDILTSSGSNDDSSFSLGVGADYGFNDKFRFTLELTSYLDKDDFSASAFSFGVQF